MTPPTATKSTTHDFIEAWTSVAQLRWIIERSLVREDRDNAINHLARIIKIMPESLP